jgi:hypothetical protein
MKLGFYVLRGANPNYLPVLVQYANRDGTVVKMDLMCSMNGRPTGRWEPMYLLAFNLDICICMFSLSFACS